jgi:adenylate cyclase
MRMSVITELKRRNVLRVAAAYVALAWLVVQVLDTLAPMFGLSEAAARLIVIAMAIGLVPVLIVSWLFELTPEGFRRESDVDHGAQASRDSARRLDRAIIGLLAVAVVYFAFDKFMLDPARDAEIASEAAEQARDEALLGSFGDRSIAVLPFADLSPSGDQEYFSDGVAEEIINLLSTIREIRVISRSSAFSFKGQTLPLSEVAERLDVRYIMEGSVRRAGDRLRITAQMIDARTDTQLWSENFDREFGDVFAIQDEIAAEVVDKLAVELNGEMPTSRAVDPEAYALYLQAKDRLNLQTKSAVDEAEKLLQQSLAIDDQQVAAWLLFWDIYAGKVFFHGWTWPEWAIQVREPVETALAIDPHNVRAKAYLARLRFEAMSTWKGEAQALAYGMSLDPLSIEFNVQVGRFLRTLGLAVTAVPYYDYATQRDPLTASLWRGKMNTNLHAGRYEEALEANTRLREIVGAAGGLWNRGRIYLALGDLENARACFEGWAEAEPESDVGFLGLLLVHDALGNDDIVAENLAKLEELGNFELLAAAYARLGRHEDALDLLEAHIAPPREFGPSGMRQDPLYEDIRDHPRFAQLLRQQGTGDDAIAAMELDKLFPGPGLPPTIPVTPP